MHVSGRGSGLLGGRFGTILDHVWGSPPPQSRGASPPDLPGNVSIGFAAVFFRFLTFRNLKEIKFQGLDFLFRSFVFVRRGVVFNALPLSLSSVGGKLPLTAGAERKIIAGANQKADGLQKSARPGGSLSLWTRRGFRSSSTPKLSVNRQSQ